MIVCISPIESDVNETVSLNVVVHYKNRTLKDIVPDQEFAIILQFLNFRLIRCVMQTELKI